ncbi:hypothetical protein [Neptunitalea lumnitzerae]|uniref:Uncharacterized protein n=1 Tax=Neptunitalea lumnitzerae TaxID=2965509 RepID=A0ABQ5MH89_9FLAO|nr:hypothetical protein [Neptunitalea sp. Y10]GLB48760.1 hypothetical protein Y10_11280 [Neptunitalea sp. Y10]
MVKRVNIFLFIASFISLHYCNAQTPHADTPTTIFKHAVFLNNVNPLHPFGIFTIDAPLYVGTFTKKRHQFSASYDLGNIWHPQSTVYYPKNLTPTQKQEINKLYFTQRPKYFLDNDIETEEKTFSTDGVLQRLRVSYLLELEKKGSLLVTLNTHWLSGGNFPLMYPASDQFIEEVHDLIGKEDNFGRRLYPFNKAHIEFIDENNNSIRIDKGSAFLGTLDTHYWLPIWQSATKKHHASLQAGGHLGIPLNSYYPKVSGGISATAFYRQGFGTNFTMDFTLQGLTTHHALVNLGDAPKLIDRDLRNSFKLYMGCNFYKSKKNKTFFVGILNNYQDAYLKGYIYSGSQDQYENLGVSILRASDTWEGEDINSVFPLSKLTSASMYFFSIKTYFLIGTRSKKGDFNFTIGEDILSINNAPDIQYGISYSYNL